MALLARSASEPVTTGRILKSKAYLQDSLARKERIKVEDEANALLQKLQTGNYESIPFVPPELETMPDGSPFKRSSDKIHFYGGGQTDPRVKATVTRKTFKQFSKR